MMNALVARGAAIARAAQGRRLERIVDGLRAGGIPAEVTSESVTGLGRQLVRRWLSDPAIRFAGRLGR